MTRTDLAIETKSIDYVPDNERHGRVRDQVSFWFLGNFHFFTVAIGFVGPSMGLSFGYTALAGTVGILFGTLFAAFHASQGAELGLPLGQRATLVQFSTAFCAPCRATRRILAEVAGMIDGVAHVEIDAESHLDLVRRLDIRRTPTVLVIGPDGRIAKRASGQPRKADVIAAVGEVS